MTTKLPTVAIIGRANAGKSSLFNRITGRKQAIVAREAGTTRDNVTSQINHKQRSFWLVDTAGLKDPQDQFETSIQEQIEEAIAAADVILVVVDSTKYPNHQDRLVAKKALRSRKPILLITNKADLKESLPINEFREFGIKTILPTSAEHNRGITEVLDELTKYLPVKPRNKVETDDILRLAFIGRPNVGKSSLFNTLAGKQQAVVASKAGTTRDINRVSVRFNNRQIEILDTAGIRRPGRQVVGVEKFSVLRSLQAIEEADIGFLVMDVNELSTKLDQHLAGIISQAGKGMVIVVSKWDTVKSKDAARHGNLTAQIAEAFNFTPWAPLIFTSSLSGQNVAKLFDLALDIDARRHQVIQTSSLNNWLQKAVLAHPPAGLKNTRPKLRYITQTDTAPPWFTIYGSDLKLLHWSYKRYLEKQLRGAYDYAGTPIKFSFREKNNS